MKLSIIGGLLAATLGLSAATPALAQVTSGSAAISSAVSATQSPYSTTVKRAISAVREVESKTAQLSETRKAVASAMAQLSNWEPVTVQVTTTEVLRRLAHMATTTNNPETKVALSAAYAELKGLISQTGTQTSAGGVAYPDMTASLKELVTNPATRAEAESLLSYVNGVYEQATAASSKLTAKVEPLILQEAALRMQLRGALDSSALYDLESAVVAAKAALASAQSQERELTSAREKTLLELRTLGEERAKLAGDLPSRVSKLAAQISAVKAAMLKAQRTPSTSPVSYAQLKAQLVALEGQYQVAKADLTRMTRSAQYLATKAELDAKIAAARAAGAALDGQWSQLRRSTNEARVVVDTYNQVVKARAAAFKILSTNPLTLAQRVPVGGISTADLQ